MRFSKTCVLASTCILGSLPYSFDSFAAPKDITFKMDYVHGSIHAYWRFADVHSGDLVSLHSNNDRDGKVKWDLYFTPTRLKDGVVKIVAKIRENGELITSPEVVVSVNQPAQISAGDSKSSDYLNLKLVVEE